MMDVLLKTAKKSGNVLLDYFKRNLKISYKSSHHDLITEADKTSQKLIIKTITESLNKKGVKTAEIGFICEEDIYKKGKYTFIIDPLDGTSNFTSKDEYFAISIAFSKDDNILEGVIYYPYQDIFYWAQKNNGCYKINKNKKTSIKINYLPIKKIVLATHYSKSSEIYRKKISQLIVRIFPYLKSVRINECATLDYCRVADNLHQIYINPTNFIWDIAAAKLIVEEAGGLFTDWQGNSVALNLQDYKKHYSTLACHPKHLSFLLRFLK